MTEKRSVNRRKGITAALVLALALGLLMAGCGGQTASPGGRRRGGPERGVRQQHTPDCAGRHGLSGGQPAPLRGRRGVHPARGLARRGLEHPDLRAGRHGRGRHERASAGKGERGKGLEAGADLSDRMCRGLSGAEHERGAGFGRRLEPLSVDLLALALGQPQPEQPMPPRRSRWKASRKAPASRT